MTDSWSDWFPPQADASAHSGGKPDSKTASASEPASEPEAEANVPASSPPRISNEKATPLAFPSYAQFGPTGAGAPAAVKDRPATKTSSAHGGQVPAGAQRRDSFSHKWGAASAAAQTATHSREAEAVAERAGKRAKAKQLLVVLALVLVAGGGAVAVAVSVGPKSAKPGRLLENTAKGNGEPTSDGAVPSPVPAEVGGPAPAGADPTTTTAAGSSTGGSGSSGSKSSQGSTTGSQTPSGSGAGGTGGSSGTTTTTTTIAPKVNDYTYSVTAEGVKLNGGEPFSTTSARVGETITLRRVPAERDGQGISVLVLPTSEAVFQLVSTNGDDYVYKVLEGGQAQGIAIVNSQNPMASGGVLVTIGG